MLKSIIIVFWIVGKSWGEVTVDDCYKSGHRDKICRYMKEFGKTYNNVSELALRASAVHAVVERETEGVLFGHTSRSDRLSHELKRNPALKLNAHVGRDRPLKQWHVQVTKPGGLSPIDWRDVGGVSYVSPVLVQGECGCCYAFAAATVLEYWSKKHGNPKHLSVQHLMDCTSTEEGPNDGCDGGLMEFVFEYGSKYSIVLEADTPYEVNQEQCPSGSMYSHVRVGNWKVLERETLPNTEAELEMLLHRYGPVAIGVDSSQWDNYRGGTFRHTMCTNDIDHAVAIVGYTADTWIVKNSWGTDWGDNGYIYLERGHNTCGVAEYVTYISDAYPILNMAPSWSEWDDWNRERNVP